MKNPLVSISILNANFLNLEQEIVMAQNIGIEWLHFDVMDGHFVPNISFGAPILSSISQKFKLFNDVHLMISDPKKYYMDFVKAGADLITFHLESLKSEEEVVNLVNLIKKENVKVGISIKPNTDVKKLLPFLNLIDLILIMSVEPGFGGQKFMDTALDKIEFLSKYKDENSLQYLIEVDGGINNITYKKCASKGVDVCVIGSYLLKSEDMKKSYELLME